MNLNLTEDQKAVSDLAGQILREKLPHERLRAIEADGGWFDECTLLVGHSIGEAHDLVLVNGCNFPHPAPAMRQSDASHGGAKMLQAAPAVGASTAIGERHDRNPIALAH